MASPNTIQYALAREDNPGTTNATPAFLIFPHVLGDNVQRMGESVESPVIMPGGASDGITVVTERNEGSLKTQLQRDAATDVMIESAMGANFNGTTIKANNRDVAFTLQKQFREGNTIYTREWTGMRAKKMSVSVQQGGIVDVGFDLIGMGEAFAASTGATYVPGSTAFKRFSSLDVSVSVAGLPNVEATDLSFDIESDREVHHSFGRISPRGVGTSGTRKVAGSITIYTRDYTVHQMARAKTGVSITIGQVGDGYRFDLPACVFMPASDEEDGSRMMTKLEFTAGYDGTTGTDVIISGI